jgi:type IV secretion system protein VirB10
MNAAPSPASQPAPDVSIRARPPSPKRLSRKVLLGGAGLAAIVIIFAVVTGLSATPLRRGAQQQAAVQATTPPESITEASGQYDARDLARDGQSLTPPPDAPAPSTSGPELAPPQDPVWSGGAATGQSGAAATHQTQIDPETTARKAPILFASAASRSPRQSGEANGQQSDWLDAALAPPRSPFEIKAGDVIPAALVTGLNSDVAGRVIAQVTMPVYDTVTGQHLLIPQGSRLIGTYDNNVRYGDARIVLVWNRLILPNGWSIDLDGMNGADPTGAAGIADRTDNHLWRLGGAVGLSAIISVIAGNSENEQRAQSLTQSVGDAAAQQAAQTGSQIVGRELAVHPTLRVRPGANVRVLVTRDIDLRPYPQATGSQGNGDARTP